MAGLVITVGGANITAYVDVYSVKIDEIATSGIVGTASFNARDDTDTITIAEKAAVTIVDDGATIFGGEVVDSGDGNEGLARTWKVTCQDYNIYLDETVIESETWAVGGADSGILADLFTEHRNDINSVTYVSTIDISREAVTWAGMTLRECLDDLCRGTGGRYYVDYDLNLHYFATEANAAAFGLSTEPDYATTYSYGGFTRSRNAGQLANKIFVQGKEVSGWVESAVSITAYGERHAVNRDQRITTAQGVTDRGSALLDRYGLPRSTYELWTYAQGLRAGMSIELTNSVWGISAQTYYIRRLRTEFLGADGDTERRHSLWLDDEPPTSEIRTRNVDLRLGNIETVVNVIDDTVFDTDAPAAPTFEVANLTTGVDLDADGHQIVYVNVTWGSVADADLDHYDVQLGTAADLSGYTILRIHPAGGARQEQFRGLPGNTAHYVRVRAVDWAGNTSDWSTIRSVTTAKDASAPDQVAGVVAAGARTLINLTWTASSAADLSYYEVQRSTTAGGVYATIGTAKGTIYSDSGHTEAVIQAATTYYYKVRAVDTSGNAGTYSAVVNAALNPLGSDSIAANAIIAVKIAASTITADKMNVATLSAITANLGTITAGTVTGATIRTAATPNARVQFDSTNGIQAYDATNTQRVSIQTSGAGWLGSATSIAWNTAGALTIDGGLLVDGTIVATAFTNAIGQPLFSAANGLLLLGPHAAMTATSWTSSRGQAATLSGAFHQVQGRWLGTRGLVVEEATSNFVLNPVFGAWTGAVPTGWSAFSSPTTAQATSFVYADTYSCRVQNESTEANRGIVNDVTAGIADGTSYQVSVWVYVAAGTMRLGAFDGGAYTNGVYASSSGLGWQRLEVTKAGASGIRVGLFAFTAGADGYFDGVQVEAKTATTSLCWGGAGAGYTWFTGIANAHNTQSVREVTVCSLDAHVALISGRAAWSFRLVAQMSYDYDGTWPSATQNVLFSTRGADNNNRVDLGYNPTTGLFYVYINGANRVSSAAQTFAAGAWVEFLVTLDFTNDSYYLYTDGVASAEATTALTAPTLTAWRLGATYANTAWANAAIAEFGPLGAVLTADEAAALYIWGKSLVDAGATDLPGVYIADGRFRLYSRIDGARTEIDVSGIKAYSASAQSVWIKVTGDALFGSNITAPGTTAIAIIATAQTYNSEALGAGDVLFGDNTASKANMLWDVSDGLLRFRGGTTTQVYIATDGALMAGGGAIKISAAANVLFSVASANQGVVWYNAAGFTAGTDTGYIQVATSTGIMTINTGGDGLAGWKDFYIQTRSSDGSTRTPLYIDAGDKIIGIYQGTPLGTVHIKQDDAAATHAVLVLEQDDVDAPYIRFLDATVYTGKTPADEYIKVQLGASDRFVQVCT